MSLMQWIQIPGINRTHWRETREKMSPWTGPTSPIWRSGESHFLFSITKKIAIQILSPYCPTPTHPLSKICKTSPYFWGLARARGWLEKRGLPEVSVKLLPISWALARALYHTNKFTYIWCWSLLSVLLNTAVFLCVFIMKMLLNCWLLVFWNKYE